MALICLGISGGTTLNHTEDLGALLGFHAGTTLVTHDTGTPAPDSCVACQWENSLFDTQVPAVPILYPPLSVIPLLSNTAQTRSPHPFDHTSPRAPPRLS